MQKEQLLREKVKIWDDFFCWEQSELQSGGSNLKKGHLKNENGRESGTKQKPYQMSEIKKKEGEFLRVQDSGTKKRATNRQNTFLCSYPQENT